MVGPTGGRAIGVLGNGVVYNYYKDDVRVRPRGRTGICLYAREGECKGSDYGYLPMGMSSMCTTILTIVGRRVRIFISERVVLGRRRGSDEMVERRRMCARTIGGYIGRVSELVRLGDNLCTSCARRLLSRGRCLRLGERCSRHVRGLGVRTSRCERTTDRCRDTRGAITRLGTRVLHFGKGHGLARRVISLFMTRMHVCRGGGLRVILGCRSRLGGFTRLGVRERTKW